MASLAILLPQVVALARNAGEAILRVYNRNFSVTQKGDSSPLTEADLAAHRIIMDKLAKLTPDIPRLSEEGADIPFEERQEWKRFWLIDPLDGTKEFVKRNGEFTVNIALVDHGRPVLGVVHAPVLQKTYYAAEGCGAWLGNGGVPRPLRTTTTAQTPRLVVSRSHVTPELEAFLAKLPKHDAINIGSSLKFCLVAEGKADFYPRIGLTSEWDTAAGHCVVEQAGGSVTDTSFKPLRYNTHDTLLNPHFFVIGDPSYPWARHLG